MDVSHCLQHDGGDKNSLVRPWMHGEADKHDGFHGLVQGQRHGLSLRLVNPYYCNSVRSNSATGDLMDESSCSCVEHSRSESDAASSNCVEFRLPITKLLQNSPYLKPAQQLLDEVVRVRNSSMAPCLEGQMICGERSVKDVSVKFVSLSSEKQEVELKIAKLVSLLQELENHRQQYFHQMDVLVSSFEAVAGAGAAAAYTGLTMQAMSKHFSNLKDSIITNIASSREVLSKSFSRNHGATSLQNICQSSKPKSIGSLQSLGMIRVPRAWRPLRGLPENSVAVLRAWLFEHFLHPYPSDYEKLLLASKTGLTRNQISNWFINARVRLWKPMIEEMYREEFAEDQEDSNPSS